MAERTERLKELVEKKARHYGDFTLASGQKADHYFDLKNVLLDPEGASLIGESIFDVLVANNIWLVGGYGLGGSLIVAEVITTSFQKEGKPIFGFLVREEIKNHGTQKQIEGYLGRDVAIVDDVLSTGGSVFKAIEAVEKKKYSVAIVVVILDRQLGGSEELRRRGYNLKAFFRADPTGEIYIE